MLELFFSRTDVFPYQWYSRPRQMAGYAKACIHRPPWLQGGCEHKVEGRGCRDCPSFEPIPVGERAINLHLSKAFVMGTYQLALDGSSIKWACLDLDDHGEHPEQELRELALVLRAYLLEYGFPTVAEASGGQGFRCHLWIFFAAPVPAIKARVVLDALLREWKLDDYPGLELFPKQSRALNGYGNLVKLPLGLNKKTGRYSHFLDGDLEPIRDPMPVLLDPPLVDPTVLDFILDVRNLSLDESTCTTAKPAKNFDHPIEAMNRVLTRCWYFRELEKRQISREHQVHYEDWWNYVLMLARFGDAGFQRILQFSTLDDRYDEEYTRRTTNYIREKGYHAPSCRRLREGPGLLRCPRNPLECGAA